MLFQTLASLCQEELPPNRRGFWIGFGEVVGSILERFLERCWRGFGEFFGNDFDTLFILFCISCWKGLMRSLCQED